MLRLFFEIVNFSPQAGIKKWGTDEETFIEIFTSRSFHQLRAMLPEYKKVNVNLTADICHYLLAYLLFVCFFWHERFLANLKWFGWSTFWAGTKPVVACVQASTMLFRDTKPNQPKPVSQVECGCDPVNSKTRFSILFRFAQPNRKHFFYNL